MRVLLIYPNSSKEIIGWGDFGAIAEPLALEYVGTGVQMDGHDVQILDLRLHPDVLDLTLLDYGPDVVGLTGYSMHVLRDLAICRRVKELLPTCKTVVGGHHATLLPGDFLEPPVDYVVEGEGVFPFRRILERLGAKQPTLGIPGVWSRANGVFEYGGPPAHFDIDRMPVSDRSLTAQDRASYFIDWMRPIALVRTTVGCPYRCSFCSLWQIMDGRYHKRNIASVVEELLAINERYIFLVDDEPFVDPRRMQALAAAIGDARIEKEYFAYCRIDSFLRDRELMRRWREIGLRRLFIGVETIFDHELQDYNKRLKRGEIIEAYRVARELDIDLFSGFIISPEYTAAEFEALVTFIEEHKVEYPSFTILTPIPGTECGASFDHVLEKQPNGRPNWNYFDLQHPVTRTRLPRDEFMQHYRDLYRVFAPRYLRFMLPDHPMFTASLLKGLRLAREDAANRGA